jgi:hypothetical protein
MVRLLGRIAISRGWRRNAEGSVDILDIDCQFPSHQVGHTIVRAPHSQDVHSSQWPRHTWTYEKAKATRARFDSGRVGIGTMYCIGRKSRKVHAVVRRCES